MNGTQCIKLLSLVWLALTLGACQDMKSTEYGLRFWKLPPSLGGGISSRVYRPGELVIDVPVLSRVYRFDTAVQDISWGEVESKDGYVQTRALDGNEVALAVTVSYRINPEPEALRNLIQKVAIEEQEVRDIVIATGRADIRTYMNELRTADFIRKEPRYDAVDKVRDSMRRRLAPYGIEVVRVNLDDFLFQRLKGDGTTDLSYEERLKEIQQKREDTERERSRIATVVAKKEQELNDMQASVNQLIEEAKGFRKQAQARGDAFLDAKINAAEGILAAGRAEVEGLLEQIEALNGPGGTALLKIELAKQLLKADARFVVLGDSEEKDELSVKRLDTNDLLRQIGILEGLGGVSSPEMNNRKMEKKNAKEE